MAAELYVCKTIVTSNLCHKKVPLTVFIEMCWGKELHLSLWWLKCYYGQRNSFATDKENNVPGNLCNIKANVKYPQ